MDTMKEAMPKKKTLCGRGRKPGSKNYRRALPEKIHPEMMLTIDEMAILSGKSVSFFTTNLSLARTGKRHTPMPPVVKSGRRVLCKAAAFFQWRDGGPVAA